MVSRKSCKDATRLGSGWEEKKRTGEGAEAGPGRLAGSDDYTHFDTPETGNFLRGRRRLLQGNAVEIAASFIDPVGVERRSDDSLNIFVDGLGASDFEAIGQCRKTSGWKAGETGLALHGNHARTLGEGENHGFS